MICNYWDCGWCYAPDDIETNKNSDSSCIDPKNCPHLKKIKTDIEIVKKKFRPNREFALKVGNILEIPRLNEQIKFILDHIGFIEPEEGATELTVVDRIEILEQQVIELQTKLEKLSTFKEN